MQQDKPEPISVGRREHPRLRLRVPATLTTLDGAKHVILDDLSQTGAQVTVSDASSFSKGFLNWLHFEVFADVAWQDGASCGLRFDEPVSEACLLETRRRAPGMLDLQRQLRSLAKSWTEGAPDW